MKKNILSLLLFFSLISLAQQKKTSVELNYPIPTGSNFMSNYTGIIDIGVKYRFSDQKDFTIGASLNASYLTYSMNNINISFDTKNYNFQPRLFGELKLKGVPRLHPALGLGYTFMKFTTSGRAANPEDPNYNISESQNLNGLNYNISFSFDFSKKLFAQAQYDGVKITNTPYGVPDSSYNTNATFIKLGLGYRF